MAGSSDENGHFGPSVADTSGEDDRSSDGNEDIAGNEPPPQALHTEKERRQRQCQTSKHRVPAPETDVAEAVELSEGRNGLHSQIRKGSIANEAAADTLDEEVHKKGVENERRYPKRSNRTNLKFTKEIDR
jgi:hypothetical protein